MLRFLVIEYIGILSLPVNSYIVFNWIVLLFSVTYVPYVTLNLKQMQQLFLKGI